MGEGQRGQRSAEIRKPAWLKKSLPDPRRVRSIERLLRDRGLHTVCESALCPNLGNCFERGTATFLIMGDMCTRGCRFCGIAGGQPQALDPEEPEKVADAASKLGLRHVVITSVTRDDLPDGGAPHYVATLRAVRKYLPEATVEVLVPDFQGREESVKLVLREGVDVFNHNMETVARLYAKARAEADYGRSLEVLRMAATEGSTLVKTGWMVGLGETREELAALMRDVVDVGVSMVTIGQYLRPSGEALPVVEYVKPETFEEIRREGESLGLFVHAGPFVRSSYLAGEALAAAGKVCGKETVPEIQ